jgi:(2R)-3-sulfolactate dehydrogenase (NADP+)
MPLSGSSCGGAECDGTRSHGLVYVPIYCEHVQCGKVVGAAVPNVEDTAASSIVVDAASGFAHPAIDIGFERLIPLAKVVGIAALAEHGLVGLGFTNSPASIAPVGGAIPVIGTNPFALAVPNRDGGAGLVMDQSASVGS